MFRCVAYALRRCHKQVRTDVCNYLAKNCEQTAGSGELSYKEIIESEGNTVEKYVENMRGDRVWGGALELQCVSALYSVEVRVYRFKSERNLTFLDKYAGQNVINPNKLRLAYYMCGHYDLIMTEQEYSEICPAQNLSSSDEESDLESPFDSDYESENSYPLDLSFNKYSSEDEASDGTNEYDGIFDL